MIIQHGSSSASCFGCLGPIIPGLSAAPDPASNTLKRTRYKYINTYLQSISLTHSHTHTYCSVFIANGTRESHALNGK